MKRPVTVTVIGWLFVVTGVLTALRHTEPVVRGFGPADRDYVWAIASALAALAGGVLLLRRSTWGRWLVLAWLAFHLLLTALHGMIPLVTHALLLVIISALLFQPGVSQWLRERGGES